jgi:hypothetical protein
MKKVFLSVVMVFVALFAAQIAFASECDANLTASYDQMNLVYKNSQGKVCGIWDIAVSKSVPRLPVEGLITEVIINPCWTPTKATKLARAKQGIILKDHYGPRSAGNAMGRVKFILNTGGQLNPLIRLHATNQEESIGQRVSRGCLRMRNQDGLVLASMLTGIDLSILTRTSGQKRIILAYPVKFYYQK